MSGRGEPAIATPGAAGEGSHNIQKKGGKGYRHRLCHDQRCASVPAFGPLRGKRSQSPLPRKLAPPGRNADLNSGQTGGKKGMVGRRKGEH